MASKDIPSTYDPFEEVSRFLQTPVALPRPYIRRLPPDGTSFTPDAYGYPIFPDVSGGLPGRHIGQYPSQRQASPEKPRFSMIDRIIEKVFTLLDRWSLRI